MLLELTISDFAIIDQLRIPFDPGVNALTGETGAGKSIIIDALGAVLGERVGPEVIRSGAKAARIEATFDVSAIADRPDVAATFEELGVEPDNGIVILAREIAANRSSARINGRAATASALQRIGALVVDIHGQSDHLSLLRPAEHLELLDRHAGLHPLRADLVRQVRDLRAVRTRIDEIVRNARERHQRIDLLQFQVQEIEAANLQPGEEEQLDAERSVLINAERLATDAATVYTLLSGADTDAIDALPALQAIRQAAHDLSDIAQIDPTLRAIATKLEEHLYQLEDLAVEVRTYRDAIEADPARLEVVEDRLDLIKALKRKYGATVAEVIAFGERAGAELAALTGGEADVDLLRQQEAGLLDDIGTTVRHLSDQRKAAAETLAAAVGEAMTDLNMGRSRFAVGITHHPDPAGIPLDGETVGFDETGIDRVEFLLAPYSGEALKPLARVASGGEMARLMLALKSILSIADNTPTLVFDEIDTGVGGRAGGVVGEKLWALATNHQVLVITHLAQIAGFAETHFRIFKTEAMGRLASSIDRLDEPARIEELAFMLDGVPATPASRANAREMLDRIERWKADRSAPART